MPGCWAAPRRCPPFAESQEPVCGPSTAKVPPGQEAARAMNRNGALLFREGVPDSCAEIVEVGAARIACVGQVDSANGVESNVDRRREAGRMETKSGTSF